MKKTGVVILGGTGFGAGELLRLLTMHPEAEVVSVVSQSSAGKTISTAHPHLAGFYSKPFDPSFSRSTLDGYEKKVIISALPHSESSKVVEALHKENPDCTIIDLSGDLRVKDEAAHAAAYPNSLFLPEIRNVAAYGLSELFHDKIKEARVISNPGCLATACILGLLPLSKLKVEKKVMVHAATGSSGAGKEPKATTHHPVRHANFFAYKPLFHQHLPEICETLSSASVACTDIDFVPHSLPVSRGILCTAFVTAKEQYTKELLLKTYQEYYAGKRFIRIQPEGCVELENIVGANHCDISIAVKGNSIVIHSAIDNLVKGMAGQAIQNLNINCGFPETTGLWFPSVRPV